MFKSFEEIIKWNFVFLKVDLGVILEIRLVKG